MRKYSLNLLFLCLLVIPIPAIAILAKHVIEAKTTSDFNGSRVVAGGCCKIGQDRGSKPPVQEPKNA